MANTLVLQLNYIEMGTDETWDNLEYKPDEGRFIVAHSYDHCKWGHGSHGRSEMAVDDYLTQNPSRRQEVESAMSKFLHDKGEK